MALSLSLYLVCSAFLATGAKAVGPIHPFHEARSLLGTQNRPCAVATDSEGNTYVSTFNGNVKTDSVSIYGPQTPIGGVPIVRFTPSANPGPACALAVDSGGDVYAIRGASGGARGEVVKYRPSSYPPTSTTTYEPDTSVNGTGILSPVTATSVAVDPVDQRVYVAEPSVDEAQRVRRPTASECSTATAFTLTYAPTGMTSTELPCATATNPQIEAALVEILGAGNFTLTGRFGAKRTVEFEGALGGMDIPAEAIEVEKGAGSEAGVLIGRSTTLTEGKPSKVASFEPDGTLHDDTIGEGLVPGADYYGVDVYGADGKVYVTDRAHEKVYVLDPGGTEILTEIDGPGTPGEESFAAMQAPDLAVDQANGNVLVSDIPGHGVVDEFDASGNLIAQIGPSFGSDLALAEAEPSAVAVDRGASSPDSGEVYVTSGDGAGGSIYAFGALTSTPPPEAVSEAPPTAVTQTSALLHGQVNPLGVGTESCEFVWGPAAGDYSDGSVPCSPDPGSAEERIAVSAEATGLTAHATVHYTVVITTAGGTVAGVDRHFVASAPPTATTEAATAVGERSAILNGTVDPRGGAEGQCLFEYGPTASYGTKVPCTPDPGSAGDPTPVATHLTGLRPESSYHYRVVEKTDGGIAEGLDGSFTTTAGPRIVETRAVRVTQTSAGLAASINPNGLSTTYHFEYLPLARYEVGGFSDGATISTPESGSIGAGHGPVRVERLISGMREASAYEFRVVATNAAGTSYGKGRFLFTLNAAGLPDDRGAELVSPADRGPLAITGEQVNLLRGWLHQQVAPDGSAAAFDLAPSAPGSAYPSEALYTARRSSTGWLAGEISPPVTTLTNREANYNFPSSYVYLSPDLSCGVLQTDQPLTPDTPRRTGEEGGQNLFRRKPDGTYTLLTSGVPTNLPVLRVGGGQEALATVVGAGPGCSRVFFESSYHYKGASLRGAMSTAPELYEWNQARSPHLRHVGVIPGPSGEREVAASAGAAHDAVPGNYLNAVSADGTGVIFTATRLTSPNPAEIGRAAIFLRMEGFPTLDVSLSQTATADSGSVYQGASKDGSRIFFTANAGLTSPSNSTGTDLYECKVTEDAGHLSSELTDLSVDRNPADPSGAQVDGVVAVSDDGGYVYFAARGQLLEGRGRTSAENDAADTYNLYASHAGTLAYVGGVTSALTETGGREIERDLVSAGEKSLARASADGTHLVFESSLDLTGYDSRGAPEAYLYSAPDDRTVCVSCRPDGAPPSETSVSLPLLFARPQHNPLNPPLIVSEHGDRVIFESPESLATGAVDGMRNLYEWEDGTVYLLATGGAPLSHIGILSEVQYAGAGENGDDVFIATPERLAPQARDGRRALYDLRVGGGFPTEREPAPPCDALSEGACQGRAAAAPPSVTPVTRGFTGPGDASPAKRHHRHKKKHQKRHRRHHRRRGKRHKKRHKGNGTDKGPNGKVAGKRRGRR